MTTRKKASPASASADEAAERRITLSTREIEAITGYKREPDQLRELLRRGFKRTRRGGDGRLIVERAHYEAVCAGTAVLAARLAAQALKLPALEKVPLPVAAPPPAPVPPPPPPPAPRTKAPARVTLQEWAARNYDPPPSPWTLRRWVRHGELYPGAELVGKTYYIDERAKRLTGAPEPRKSLVEQLEEAEGRLR